jgi:predicted DNA binding CopG/RHH family protein
MKKLKKLPKFKHEKEERDFWLSHDSSEYLDWSKAKFTEYVNLKPSTRSISIRMPEYLLMKIKSQANKVDVPYQSYLKIILADKVRDIEAKSEYKVD